MDGVALALVVAGIAVVAMGGAVILVAACVLGFVTLRKRTRAVHAAPVAALSNARAYQRVLERRDRQSRQGGYPSLEPGSSTVWMSDDEQLALVEERRLWDPQGYMNTHFFEDSRRR